MTQAEGLLSPHAEMAGTGLPYCMHNTTHATEKPLPQHKTKRLLTAALHEGLKFFQAVCRHLAGRGAGRGTQDGSKQVVCGHCEQTRAKDGERAMSETEQTITAAETGVGGVE